MTYNMPNTVLLQVHETDRHGGVGCLISVLFFHALVGPADKQEALAVGRKGGTPGCLNPLGAQRLHRPAAAGHQIDLLVAAFSRQRKRHPLTVRR